jgi:carbamoyl-phosphate synthase large subunit
MKNNILITSAGRRVSLVQAFKKELSEFFPNAKVITTDLKPELSAACQVSDKAIKICEITNENYIDELLFICNTYNIRMLIPTIDTELRILALNKEKFVNVHIIVSSLNFIEICRDKRKTNLFFIQNGINVPKSIDKKVPTFPLFIKPFNGSLSSEIHHIKSASELTTYLLNDEKFMFMEYLSPKEYDEFTVDMYYDKNNELKCLIPRKRIEVRGGEVSKGLTLKNEIFSFISSKLNKIEGAIGCLTLQVFLHKEKKYIIGIEINPRFGGGFPLSYNAGGNFPKWLILEYLLDLNNLPIYNSWKENLLMLRYDEVVLINNFNE